MSKSALKYARISAFMIVSGACAHAAGTDPHDMSVAQHEAAAAQEQQQDTAHSAQVDPNARAEQTRCSPGKGSICWTEMVNPTAPHMKTAEEHRTLAAQHRSASQALRDAEASACAGLSADDRDTSPFAHTADIQSVAKLEQRAATYADTQGTDGGATIVFRAAPGLTTEWLQRIVNCHIARNSAAGHDMPEMPYCPLVPRGVQANVRSVGDGFAVDVVSKDPATAAEIWRRAQQLQTGT